MVNKKINFHTVLRKYYDTLTIIFFLTIVSTVQTNFKSKCKKYHRIFTSILYTN